MALTLPAVARILDARDLLTADRASVLQRAAAADRPEHYRCSHPEHAGAGWSHPWPDQVFLPHACCGAPDHCPAEWTR